jgi:hypothetical protein
MQPASENPYSIAIALEIHQAFNGGHDLIRELVT